MNRRSVLRLLPAAGLTIVTSDLLSAQGKEQIEVTPAEDLMREHGLLKRILLIYEEIGRRIAAQKDLPTESVTNSARIIRSFIEEYHEKLEEDYLFPRFRKHGVLVDLVNTLQQQHQAGRRVTLLADRAATPDQLLVVDDTAAVLFHDADALVRFQRGLRHHLRPGR